MASLTDPLTLMREYTMAKKPITLDGDHIVFGRTRFPRKAKTAFTKEMLARPLFEVAKDPKTKRPTAAELLQRYVRLSLTEGVKSSLMDLELG